MPYNFDHRQLADEMEIFFLDEQIGAGLPVWLPNGVAIRDELEAYVKRLERNAGYHRVSSPHIGKSDLYNQSGHLRAFSENMFPPMKWPEDPSEYYLRPMNCPHHHKIFASSLRSYKNLPLRLAEYGQVYRYENSGSLKGLSRVRGLCQNDAHIYIDRKDAAAEIIEVLKLHEKCYSDLDLKGYRYRLSRHSPSRMNDFDGPLKDWQESEAILRECLVSLKLPFYEAEGEAAFYGPKIDVQIKMGSGGEESISSVQLDFNAAEKFELSFVGSDGKLQRPWIIHRAPLGSHERFIALLLEYYDGQLPGWLSPIQVSLLPVGEEQIAFAKQLAQRMLEAGIRAKLEEASGSLSKRILFAHRSRPFCKIVLGAKEVSSGQVQVEFRKQKQRVQSANIEKFLSDYLKPPE